MYRSGLDDNPLGMGIRIPLVKLQTFSCWVFTSQPTPFFGACLSTSGLSLFGISRVSKEWQQRLDSCKLIRV